MIFYEDSDKYEDRTHSIDPNIIGIFLKLIL